MDGDGQDPAAWQLQADWHLPRTPSGSWLLLGLPQRPRLSQGTTAKALQCERHDGYPVLLPHDRGA